MATVPTSQGPTVAANPLPNGYQAEPRGLDLASRARSGMWQQASQAANNFAQQYEREQLEADQVRVDDAINAAKERQIDLTFGRDKGFTHLKGINALQRESGQPLADEYSSQYQEQINAIASGLGNERQRRAFLMRANDMLTSFRGQVTQYEGQQFSDYTLSVREGTIENRKREVGLFYNDPSKIDEALASIHASVTDMGRNLGGKSAEWIEARSRKEQSNALMVAFGAAIERNDMAYADGFLKKYADRFDADDMLKARGVLDRQIDASIAMHTATGVMQFAQRNQQPTNLDRVFNITMQTESGGRRYGPDGQILTSSAGAKGEMQVMDGTNRDPGFGVKPAKDDNPEERARVGRDYMAAMVKRYEGNLALAWAAYNAGPGAVDAAQEAVKKEPADYARRGEVPSEMAWLSKMPAETQKYVAKNMAAYQTGEGRPQQMTLQDVHNQVREQIGTGNPQRLKLALDESTRQWEDMQKAIKQRDDAAVADAQRWLASNDGRFSMMPASLRTAVPPAQLDNLLEYGRKVARGEDRTDPVAYQKLSDRDFLRSLSENEFFTYSSRYLSEADRKHFANERGRLLTGAAGDKPGDLNSSGIKSVLDQRLRELRIDPTPKDDGGNDAARIGAIRQYVDQSILRAQAAAGKKFTDAEVSKHIDGLFAQTAMSDGWFRDSSAPMLTQKVGDIPSNVKTRLKADFKSLGVDDPTDAQLLGAYWQAMTAARRNKR